MSRPAKFHPSRLFTAVDGDSAAYVRIVFGVVGFCWVAKQIHSGAVQELYIAPQYHFHYWGFQWVPKSHPLATHIEFYLLGVAAMCVTFGCMYRVAALAFAIGFSHLFLLDKCLYQNHYYLLCLVSWVMVFVPAHRVFSVDARIFRPSARSTVPRWAIWILRFQIGLPYFFGGIAKLNSDWLAGVPVRQMLAVHSDAPVIGPWMQYEWCVWFFVFGGILFDLFVVPALLVGRWRPAACVFAIAFHFINARLFPIGVFPWFMVLTLPVFFPPGSFRSWVGLGLQRDEPVADRALTVANWVSLFFLAFFVFWQALFPLRHFAIPGNPSWTEEGHYFAWHMLIRGKKSGLRLLATDPRTGNSGAVDLRPFVTGFQLNRVSRDPRLIHQLAVNVERELRSLGFQGIEVRALALVSMNGRKPQLLIDPTVDLAQQVQTWQKPGWIVPLHEPLRSEPWDVPLQEWEQVVKTTLD